MANTSTWQSRPVRAVQARTYIHTCEASGQRIVAHCRANGLYAPSFHWWKRKLSSSSAPSILFAEVHPESIPSDGQDAAIENLLDSGIVARVRVHPCFDAATFARVMAVLE